MPKSDAAPTGTLRTTVPLLMMVVACGHFNRVGIAVAGTERIMPERGLTPEQMGLVYSAFLVTYTIAMLPGGWFIDRFGSRTALMFFCFGSAVLVGATGLTGFLGADASSLLLGLLIVRAVMGVFNAPLHPSAAHVVFERIPWHSKAFANGLVTFAACAGIAATYTTMGTLMDRLGWPTAFFVTSGLTFLVGIVWTLGSRRPPTTTNDATPHAHERFSFASLFEVLRQPSVICLALSYGTQGYFQYLFFYWIQYYFETIQKQSQSVSRGYTTTVILAMGIGMICGGWLTDRVPRFVPPRYRRVLVPMLSMLFSGIVFELGAFAPTPELTLAAFTLSAALIGACEGGFWTAAVALGGRFGGLSGGFMNTVGNLTGTLSPTVTPLLGALFAARYGEELGWRLSLAVAGVVVILGAALWLGVRLEGDGDAR